MGINAGLAVLTSTDLLGLLRYGNPREPGRILLFVLSESPAWVRTLIRIVALSQSFTLAHTIAVVIIIKLSNRRLLNVSAVTKAASFGLANCLPVELTYLLQPTLGTALE